MANPCNPAGKSSLLQPANPCTPLDNSKITWICQVEQLGFAGGANGICQSDYKGLPEKEKVDFLMYELQKWLQKWSSGSKSTKMC